MAGWPWPLLGSGEGRRPLRWASGDSGSSMPPDAAMHTLTWGQFCSGAAASSLLHARFCNDSFTLDSLRKHTVL